MRILFLLLIATLFKDLAWQIIVPIWHTPDEQAHFVQLQWYAEKNNLNIDPQKNLSVEVATFEDFFGTRRDNFGNNKFTYHPEYKTHFGKSLPDLPIFSRTQYVDKEAAGYPPFYYLLSVPTYNLFYNHNLIDRLFAGRILSLILNLLLVTVAFLIGKEIWPKRVSALILATLVSFQPMVTFVAAGFHPDNLLNLLFTLGILVCLLILKNGIKPKYLIFITLTIILGLWTKILMVFFIPLAFSVIAYQFFKKRTIGFFIGAIILTAPVAAFVAKAPLPYMPQINQNSPLVDMTFVDYMRFRGPKILFEMWPWYWGVYKWLGVTLPPLVLKVVTRAAVLAGLGIAIKMLSLIKNKNFSFENRSLIFFIIATASYLLYLVVWDYRLMQSIGYSQGLQGRYLFTNIVPEMAMIIFGFTGLLPKRWAAKTGYLGYILAFAMVALNFVSLLVVAGSYYDLSSLGTFINQASQYKPAVLKGNTLSFILLCGAGSTLLFLAKLFRYTQKSVTRHATTPH